MENFDKVNNTYMDINTESSQYKMCIKKKSYSSEIQAAAVAGKQEFKHNIHLRWYKCFYCSSWHLTHTERR